MLKNKSDRVVRKILTTKNYEMFKFRNDNREVKKYHVNDIYKKMLSNGWLKTSVITVNENGEIIDGQHRLAAAMAVGCPVNYQIVRNSGINEISEMNALQKNWSPFDHLNRYSDQGIESYKKFKEFSDKYPFFKLTECAMMLNNSCSTIKRSTFESGEYEIRNYDKAIDVAEKLKSLKPYFPIGYNKSSFVRAMLKLLFDDKKSFDFNRFVNKLSLRPGMAYKCSSKYEYIEMIEKIYNYRTSNKINLRF